MSQSADITNRDQLRNLLLSLQPDAQPLWGKMKAQQMVEHLIDQVQWTNGKKVCTCDRPAHEAAKSKQLMIYTDAQIPKNVFLEELPVSYLYTDIPASINQLMTELDDFDRYFQTAGITAMHGGFGPMNYQEWIIWHNKHFTHHLKQFGLL
jgi:hypothetical protein